MDEFQVFSRVFFKSLKSIKDCINIEQERMKYFGLLESQNVGFNLIYYEFLINIIPLFRSNKY